MNEESLEGGRGQDAPPIKIGDTVRRNASKRSAYVHDVLEFLESADYAWSPKFLGVDEQGREILEYIDGYVPHGQDVPNETWSLETMEETFKKIREFHDITAGTALAESKECVVHGDLGYYNTVYENGRGIKFIDWDFARPGKRISDVAFALNQYLSIGEYEGDGGPKERAALARKLVDAYGLSAEQRMVLTQQMLNEFIGAINNQVAEARKGKLSAIKLVEAGVPERLKNRHDWLERNRAIFDDAFFA